MRQSLEIAFPLPYLVIYNFIGKMFHKCFYLAQKLKSIETMSYKS